MSQLSDHSSDFNSPVREHYMDEQLREAEERAAQRLPRERCAFRQKYPLVDKFVTLHPSSVLSTMAVSDVCCRAAAEAENSVKQDNLMYRRKLSPMQTRELIALRTEELFNRYIREEEDNKLARINAIDAQFNRISERVERTFIDTHARIAQEQKQPLNQLANFTNRHPFLAGFFGSMIVDKLFGKK